MGLTVADVVELPKKEDCGVINCGDCRGFNRAIDEISSLPLSPEKVVGMVSINEEELAGLIRDCCSVDDDCFNCREAKRKARKIISNKSKILGVKKCS